MAAQHRDVRPQEAAQQMANLVTPAAARFRAHAITTFSMNEMQRIPDSAVSGVAASAIAERTGLALQPETHTSIPAILSALGESEFSVSTRFHGFILSLMLGCRAAAPDCDLDGGKVRYFYEQWLGRRDWPSLYSSQPLQESDFVSLQDCPQEFKQSLDGLLDSYVAAIHRALPAR
jgi:polysaccharide pyruvyl transferase WcaK-like protein